jgi:hypothetical protein
MGHAGQALQALIDEIAWFSEVAVAVARLIQQDKENDGRDPAQDSFGSYSGDSIGFKIINRGCVFGHHGMIIRLFSAVLAKSIILTPMFISMMDRCLSVNDLESMLLLLMIFIHLLEGRFWEKAVRALIRRFVSIVHVAADAAAPGALPGVGCTVVMGVVPPVQGQVL